jgi:hypothetical protein
MIEQIRSGMAGAVAVSAGKVLNRFVSRCDD